MFGQWLSEADQERSKYSIQLLQSFGKAGLIPRLDKLVSTHYKEHKQAFESNPSLVKIIEGCKDIWFESRKYDIPPDDLSLTHTFASMCQFLGLLFEESGQAKIAAEYAKFHKCLLLEFLNCSNNQIFQLCKFVINITEFLKRLASPNRIVLIEMPSGNSIVTKLLEAELGKLFDVHTLPVVLSRKNPDRLNLTRKDLLRERLQTFAFQNNDIVVLADEWITGSNFKTVTEYINKLLPKEVYFLPAAFMTMKSQDHERFESFCGKHDSIVRQNWGEDGSKFRAAFPKLNTKNTQLAFFWSENDRMAGYRKMQMHGSFFSSLDQTLKDLSEDNKKLEIAAGIFVATMSECNKQEEVPQECYHQAVMNGFPKWYADYLEVRNQLKYCAEEDARGGLVEDFEKAFSFTGSQCRVFMKGRDAELACELALRFANRLGSPDPADRYYFDNHAPFVIPLTGYAAIQHETAMTYLLQFMEQLKVEI